MGSQYKEDCPFCADNARKRREEIEAAHREAFPEKVAGAAVSVELRLRPIHWRLYYHYKAFRNIGIGAFKSARMSWQVACGMQRRWKTER